MRNFDNFYHRLSSWFNHASAVQFSRGLNLLLLLILFISISLPNAFSQGTTTSAISGKVMDKDMEPLIGATILAVHEPSGTVYGAASNLSGIYNIVNMRVGGPYRITVSYTGYGESVYENVFLRLGESQRFDVTLEDASLELSTVVIAASRSTSGESAGASTQISTKDIENMPTLSRDVSDYVRLTPQSSGYGGGNAIAGTNNRYNAIYVDGAVNNDVFGLSSQGTNGGQTGIAPFSIDIIDQIQVVLSPYDVSFGGFAGGGINAVTKSGTNNFEGTAYYFLQNQDLVGRQNGTLFDRIHKGKDPVDIPNEKPKVADFTNQLYGASLGGPIIKDKLFFFTNVEIRRDQTPSPFDINVYNGDSGTDELNTLRNYLQNTYNYDPGTFGDVNDELNGLSFFGKLDYNLNNVHRVTLRHNYTKGEQFDRFAGSPNTINFSNNGIYFPTTTNSSALELNSRFGNNYSNNLIIGYTTVRDDRDQLGGRFPYVFIEDGGDNVIRFGSDEFSTGNELNQDIISLTNNFKIYRGDHTITLGTHNEYYDIYNLFLPQNFGTYRFDNLQDFLTNQPATEYNRGYSLVDNITGDGSKAAAALRAIQLGLYIQDEWRVNNRFTLTGGLRLDVPFILDDPNEDKYLNFTAIPSMAKEYEVAGDIKAGKAPQGQLMWSPRVGFEFDASGDRKTILRGGMGIFTSRIPFVWPASMFNNNGLTQGRVNIQNGSVPFIADVNQQYTDPDFVVPSGQIDIFTQDFKYPQVFRTNLGVDTRLPGDIRATFEGIYTKTINNVLYTNVNSDPNVDFYWTGTPDNRPVFGRTSIDPTYEAVYVGSNTNEGYTYTLTAAFSKDFDFGLSASLSYTYGDATAVSEGTSSQNSSQWRGQVNTDGRNNPVFGRSDFALGHRVLSTLSYSINWNQRKNATTTISLLYDGQAGSPYSYLIGGNSARNLNNETGSTGRNRSLVYIPATMADINLVQYTSGGNTFTAEQQWEALNAFIESDPYLSENRGGYAEKNSNWMPFTSFLDMSVRQDFGLRLGEKFHKFQLSFDVFNLANLLNNSWGVRYSPIGDFNNHYLTTFAGYESDGTTPRFTYRGGNESGREALNIQDFSSRWRGRVGIRYIFN
jgi:hypothetical protein